MSIEFIKSLVNELVEIMDSILYAYPFTLFQFVGALASLVLFGIWIYMMNKMGVLQARIKRFREMAAESPVPKGKLSNQWKKVVQKSASNDESQWKLAIMEADFILDEVIKSLGYKGETMGERMTKIKPGQFPYLDDAWRAHKVRNFIAHDPSYKISRDVVARVIKIYELIFSEFKILK